MSCKAKITYNSIVFARVLRIKSTCSFFSLENCQFESQTYLRQQPSVTSYALLKWFERNTQSNFAYEQEIERSWQWKKIQRRQRGRAVQGTGVVIPRSRVQGLHSVTSGICFLVVLSSNSRSRFVNSQLVCLLPGGIFNHVSIRFLWFSGMTVNQLMPSAKLSACPL